MSMPLLEDVKLVFRNQLQRKRENLLHHVDRMKNSVRCHCLSYGQRTLALETCSKAQQAKPHTKRHQPSPCHTRWENRLY